MLACYVHYMFTHYPKVDIANIIKRKPKLLLSSQQRVDEDALKVGRHSV